MLSITLPLLALAVALTPVVLSARNTYKRESAEHCESTFKRSQVATPKTATPTTEVRQPVGSVKTIV
ncbi:MAG: hypothetical protein ACAF41_09295 [Leptolyngbya sp. BL-A-14]